MIITDIAELRGISSDVVSIEEEKEIISKLEQELIAANIKGANGIGLAAPQIGIKKRVAIIRIDDVMDVNLVNSKIVFKSGKTITKEGCLSIVGKTVDVSRNLDILIENHGFISTGKVSAFGLPAVCIQHEMDHWEGVLMIDKAIMRHTEIGPNLPCPCNSKLKYKKCCGSKKTK